MYTIVKLFLIYLFFLIKLCIGLAAEEQSSLFKAKQGALAQEQGRFDLAIRLYSEALEDQLLSNDYRGIFYTDRGVIYASLGYSKHALKDFNNAVKFFPEYAAAYNNRGVLLLSLNYIDESIKDFNRAAILVPDYVSALNNRAAALAAKGELVLAIADYTAAIKLSPHEVAPLAGRANVKITQRRPYAAMRDLNRALLSHPKFALGYRLRSQVHTHLNNYTQATNDINRAIAIAPMDPNSYLVRGLVYLQARKLNAAIKDFDKAIELRPKFSEAYLERGHANVLLENFEEAKRDLTRSLSLSRKSGKAFAYLALMYKKKGNPELGLQEINKAMRFGLFYGIGCAVVIAVLSGWTAAIFSDNAKVIEFSALYLLFVPLSYFAMNIFLISTSAMNALNKAKEGLALNIVKSFILSLPLVFIGVGSYGFGGFINDIIAANVLCFAAYFYLKHILRNL